jgi:hypothetical protein
MDRRIKYTKKVITDTFLELMEHAKLKSILNRDKGELSFFSPDLFACYIETLTKKRIKEHEKNK